MLKQIICNRFRKKVINFHNGFNVILGDNQATNSIGKTLLLMIIDFVFGGNSYIEKNSDVVDNIGHHEFNFELVFDDNSYYFNRSTEQHLVVSICDCAYNKKKEISLDEYKKFITEKYNNIYLGTTFRSVVGNYSRIWGKNNYDVEKPLKQQNCSTDVSITNIIKLFNKYKSIESLENQMKVKNDKKNAINKAIKNDLIPSITKVQYNKNLVELEELSIKIDKIKSQMVDVDLDINAIMSDEVMELENQKSNLLLRRNQVTNKIRRLNNNLNSEDIKVKNKIEKLVEFFPNINKNKLEEINNFHKKLSISLRKNLNEEKENLESLVCVIDQDIDLIDDKLKSKTIVTSVPKYSIERLTELLTKENAIKQMNEYYEKKQANLEELDEIKKSLHEVKLNVVTEIANSINIEIYNNFNKIYNDRRKPPTFRLDLNSYDLKKINDRGTGSSYVNLIAFDLSILKLTALPFLIHDSIMFKNIQVPAFDNLVNIYKSFNKQSFIAIDEINKFSAHAIQCLNQCKVIELDETNTLFDKNWKLDDPSQVN